MEAIEGTDAERSVRVKLKASASLIKHLNLSQLDETPSVAVPASIGRSGLTTVVLHFLREVGVDEHSLPKALEFIDVVRDGLIRSSLERHLKKNKLSEEDVLVLEYSLPKVSRFDAQGPGAPVPDWISAISVVGNIAVAGTFDGSLVSTRLENAGPTTRKVESNAHASQVTSVKAFQLNSKVFVASASKDASVSIRPISADNDAFGAPIVTCAVEQGKSFEVVASASSSDDPDDVLLAVGGWSGEVYLFQANCAALGEPDEKDRTTGEKRSRKNPKPRSCAPSFTMRGHTDKVSSCVWSAQVDPVTLFTGSWDHTLRVWDCVRQVETATLHAQKPLNAVDYLDSRQVLASAHPDHVVRLWDARASGDAVVKLSLKGHTGWVSSVAFQGGDSTLLASASYDRSVRVWDIRGGAPLQNIQTDVNGKLFAVTWGENGRLLLGGSDSTIRAYAAESGT